MNLLFTICARAGSKGIKNKNIKQFLSYPLVYFTLSAYDLFVKQYGANFNSIDLCINTDSNELIEQIELTNIPYTHIKRKEHLSGDRVSKVEVIRDSYHEMQTLTKKSYDILIDLDLTSPLRSAEDINGVLEALINNNNATISFSMTGSRRSPYFNMVSSDDNGFYNTIIKSDFIARQEVPTCYDMNASMYAYSKEFLLNEDNKKIFDGNAVGYEMPDTSVLDIDHLDDFELLELLAPFFYKKYPLYNKVYLNISEL